MMIKKIYLDIDGVLLQKDGRPADYLEAFLYFITNNLDCYWLTTHCKGNADRALEYLSRYITADELKLASKINPTNWQTYKTEVLKFSDNFIWLDDYILEYEKIILDKNGCLQKYIQINLSKSPNQLLKIIKKFEIGH